MREVTLSEVLALARRTSRRLEASIKAIKGHQGGLVAQHLADNDQFLAMLKTSRAKTLQAARAWFRTKQEGSKTPLEVQFNINLLGIFNAYAKSASRFGKSAIGPVPTPSFAFSHDFAHVASTSLLGGLNVFDTKSGKKTIEIEPAGTLERDEPARMAFSRDGKKLALGRQYGKISIYWVPSAEKLCETGIGIERVTSLAFTSDGEKLFMGNEVGEIAAFLAESGNISFQHKVSENRVLDLSLPEDGNSLAFAEYSPTKRGGTLRVFNLNPWKQFFKKRSSSDISFCYDGKRLALGQFMSEGHGFKLVVHDLAEKRNLLESDDLPFASPILAFSQDGLKLAVVDEDSQGGFLDLDTGEMLTPSSLFLSDIDTTIPHVESVAFSPGDTSLILGTSDGTVTRVLLSEFEKPKTP